MLRRRSGRIPLYLTARVLAGCAMISASVASACTIPVFRYALERWESDRFLVIVYHDGQLTAEQNSAVKQLEQRSSSVGGPLNIHVHRFDGNEPPENFLDVKAPPADRPLPWVEIRARDRGIHTALHWQGPLADAIDPPGFYASPARNEIARRILEGYSAVWLLVAPDDQMAELGEQLQAKLDAASKNQKLPSGIGLPGSELYTSIPLEIRYSVFAVSHADQQEQAFLKQLAVSAKEWRADSAYVIPIFGRGRALDVIPYGETDELLIEDMSMFICGACSCRVKQANPGFDLLTSVNWNQRLFGDSIPQAMRASEQQIAAIDSNNSTNVSEYVAIPTGNQAALGNDSFPTTKQVKPSVIEADGVARGQSGESEDELVHSDDQNSPVILKTLLFLAALSIVGGVLTRAILSR